MRVSVLAALVWWLVAILIAMAGFSISTGTTLAILPAYILGGFALGVPLIVAGLTAPSFAVSIWAVRRLRPHSRFMTFATIVAVYLVAWGFSVAVLAWVPPFGNPSRSLDVASAFWSGPAVAVALGLLIASTAKAKAHAAN